MKALIKCPHCGESYYSEHYSMTTALAWTPIYKDGKLISTNPNTTTTFCTCMNCGKDFSYNSKELRDELDIHPL